MIAELAFHQYAYIFKYFLLFLPVETIQIFIILISIFSRKYAILRGVFLYVLMNSNNSCYSSKQWPNRLTVPLQLFSFSSRDASKCQRRAGEVLHHQRCTSCKCVSGVPWNPHPKVPQTLWTLDPCPAPPRPLGQSRDWQPIRNYAGKWAWSRRGSATC